MSGPVVRVERSFKAAPERVFDAWLDTTWIGRFMFGPLLREETILHIRNDARIGGTFSYKVRRGDTEIDHVGKFLELMPPKRVAFTWAIAGQSDQGDKADLNSLEIK